MFSADYTACPKLSSWEEFFIIISIINKHSYLLQSVMQIADSTLV